MNAIAAAVATASLAAAAHAEIIDLEAFRRGSDPSISLTGLGGQDAGLFFDAFSPSLVTIAIDTETETFILSGLASAGTQQDTDAFGTYFVSLQTAGSFDPLAQTFTVATGTTLGTITAFDPSSASPLASSETLVLTAAGEGFTLDLDPAAASTVGSGSFTAPSLPGVQSFSFFAAPLGVFIPAPPAAGVLAAAGLLAARRRR